MSTQAFIQHGGNGVGSTRPMLTESVPHQTRPVPASASVNPVYGSKITSEHMVHFEGRWRRVYAIDNGHGRNHYILDRDNSKLTVTIQ